MLRIGCAPVCFNSLSAKSIFHVGLNMISTNVDMMDGNFSSDDKLLSVERDSTLLYFS